jgi:uncharacterized DUF497 family protein
MFEWDEKKRSINLRDHGVDFLYAAVIFEALTLRDVDDRQDYGETRYLALGIVGEDIFAVVYTLRGENIRLISARKARKKEYERYQNRILRRH